MGGMDWNKAKITFPPIQSTISGKTYTEIRFRKPTLRDFRILAERGCTLPLKVGLESREINLDPIALMGIVAILIEILAVDSIPPDVVDQIEWDRLADVIGAFASFFGISTPTDGGSSAV